MTTEVIGQDQVLHAGTTADGNGVDVVSDGKPKMLSAYGGFGGGTGTLNTITLSGVLVPALYEDGTAIASTVPFTATVQVAKGHSYRFVLSGATAATLSADLGDLFSG